MLAVVAVSIPSRSLTFTRDGERYRATYEIEFDLLQRSSHTAQSSSRIRARETVRVSTLRETTRDEESVIFQQLVSVPVGTYTAVLTVRDVGTSRSNTAEALVRALRFADAGRTNTSEQHGERLSRIALPLIVYTATPRASRAALPDLVMSARSTAIFGRDSVLTVYLEWYGVGPGGLLSRTPSARLTVHSEDGHQLYTDSVIASTWGADGRVATAIARLPVYRIGLGRRQLRVWQTGQSDTASVPVFVSAGEFLAAVSFEEMLSYLRYFTTADRLRALRDTTIEARAGAWTGFLRATDPLPMTPEHEGLRDYLVRLGVANARFRGEEVPGWLSDRGMVYATLGEPDRIVEPKPRPAKRQGGRTEGEGTNVRGRSQLWEYLQHRLQLVFIEQEGTRRWKLTPASEAEFQAVIARIRR